MAILPINYCLNRSHSKGLTLIEVLIALAILSIAMTAVIKATSQNIRATTYLQDKTIALWVGQEVLSEAQVGIISLTSDTDRIKQTRTMLGKEWYFTDAQEDTPNKHIKKIRVQVFASREDEASPLINLESYFYHAE